jgi:hypothetical protein
VRCKLLVASAVMITACTAERPADPPQSRPAIAEKRPIPGLSGVTLIREVERRALSCAAPQKETTRMRWACGEIAINDVKFRLRFSSDVPTYLMLINCTSNTSRPYGGFWPR